MPPKGRGPSFRDEEIDHLLDIIENIEPIGAQEWDQVVSLHNRQYSDQGRDAATLKRKFRLMYGSKTPTGDPRCPPRIRRAKLINRRNIIEKSQLSTGSGKEDDDEEEDGVGGDDDGGAARPPRDITLGSGTAAAARPGDITFGSASAAIAHAADAAAVAHAAANGGGNEYQDDNYHPCIGDGSDNIVLPGEEDNEADDGNRKLPFRTPIVNKSRRRGTTPSVEGPAFSMDKYMEMMMMRAEMEREERKELQKELALERIEERRARRQEASQQNKMMQIMMMGIMGTAMNSQKTQQLVLDATKEDEEDEDDNEDDNNGGN